MKTINKIVCSLNIILLILFVKRNKAEETLSSLFDFNFNDINDDTLKKNKDFEFIEEKESILVIKEKIKKVACLSLINKITKDSNDELKNKLKEAKETNKTNFKKFIGNMTENCVKKIKEEDINKILDYENINNIQYNAGMDILQFDEYFSRLSKQNEQYKTVKEIEIQKDKSSSLFKIIIIIICIFIAFLLLVILLKKYRKKYDEDIDDKKMKGKKKLKKN